MTGSDLGELDRLIHEPARLVLMANLYVVDEADFVFLTRQTGMTAGNISSHMSRLEDAGYVDVLKTFVGRKPRTVYRMTEAGRTAFENHKTRLAEVLGI